MRAVIGLALAGSLFAAPHTFLARRDYTDVSDNGIAVADTNGDGIPDVIGLRVGGIKVVLGNGDGTFHPGPSSKTSTSSNLAPVAADVNGDGKVDLVFCASQGYMRTGIAVALGNGDGSFQAAVLYPTGAGCSNLVVGDFNGDGILDIAAASESGIWLFTGAGGGTFNPGVLTSLTFYYGTEVASADFNQDGKLDLAATTAMGFVILLGNGDGTFQAPQSYGSPLYYDTIAIGDINGDGYPDVVVSLASNLAGIYLNNGAAGFSSALSVTIPANAPIAVGDVNGDGIPDLVSSIGYIALGNGDGSFQVTRYYPLPKGSGGATPIAGVILTDLRNNGLTDLVFQDPNAVISVLLSFGKGKFEDGEWTAISGGVFCGAAADYNGDGKPDLAVSSPTGISILLGTGNALAPFKAGSVIALSNPGCPVAGDLNGDGFPDLLIPLPNTVLAYLNNRDGTFTRKSVTVTNSSGYLVVADFNRDGYLDFATSGNLIALGKGDGTFQLPYGLAPGLGGGVNNIAVGDVNGDGWPDLVLTQSVGLGVIYVLLNNQHGGFLESSTTANYTAPNEVTLVDLNGDGKLDLVTGGTGVAVYQGDGTGGFTLATETTLEWFQTGPQFAIGDVNGDGIPDLITGTTSTLGVFFGVGDGTFQVPYDIGAGPSINGILLENLHGQMAGYADVVAPDLSGGVMVLINLVH